MYFRKLRHLALPVVFTAVSTFSLQSLWAADDEEADPGIQAREVDQIRSQPGNLGLGLRAMVARVEEASTATSGTTGTTSKGGRPDVRAILQNNDLAQADNKNRVLVTIHLDGSMTTTEARAAIEAAGGTVTAELPWYRKGLVSAWVPLGKVKSIAGAKGVRNMRVAPRREARIGAVTSQGAVVHHADTVNSSGYKGSGVTVGVISDSYDTDTYDANDPGFKTAHQDVVSGDLPGTNNPDGYTTPVNVVADDDDPNDYPTDEGRAMLQIIHDLAPASHLAFSTCGTSSAEFASNIANLYSHSNCQVMCDDIGFPDEPMFSDGPIAQAIDQVHSSGVTYFSAAGNDGNSGYSGTFTPVANALAKTRATAGGIQLSTIPPGEMNYIAEWHSFGTSTNGKPIVVQNIHTVDKTELVFQWDDPFDVVQNNMNGVTTDYDILVFNAAGQFLASRSGLDINTSTNTSPNASTNEPLEIPYRDLAAKTSYKICIVRMKAGNGSGSHPATHLRYLANAYDPITGDYITASSPTSYGHPCAAGAIGVAAYNYDISPDPDNSSHTFTPAVESYSSNGPITIYIDSDGNRLTTPEDRQQPAISAVDNVDTTFFPPSPTTPNPNDYDSDGYPNFAGTSAATPHAAAVAALLINAAAVNSLSTPSPAKILSLLENNPQGEIDQDPGYCAGTAGSVTVSASGDNPTSKKFFKIAFNGNTGELLTTLTIDMSPAGLVFDPTVKNGYPFTVGPTTGGNVPKVVGKPVYSTDKSTITITFKNFKPGDTLSFGIDRDVATTKQYGNEADSLAGSTISATVNGTVSTGTFANTLSNAYNFKAGYGLIDAQAAINALLN